MTRIRTVALMSLGLLAMAATPAATQARRTPPVVILVRTGDLFDAEAGRMVGPRDILVRGDRIAEVGIDLTAPEDATVLDLRRCTVTPGLIDAHTHLLTETEVNEPLQLAAARERAAEGDVARVLAGVQRAREYLLAGVTSVRDLGNSGRFLDLRLKRGINASRTPGPRIHGSGPGLAPAGGQMDPMPDDPHGLVAGEYRIVAGADDARAAVREAVAAGASVIKVYPEATPQRTRLGPQEMAAVVDEARRHGLPVAAHATSDRAVREAVEAGVTSIEHAYETSEETLRLMAARGVWLVPTDTGFEAAREFTESWPDRPSDDDIRAHLARSPELGRLRAARAAGVRIAAGSDLYVPARRGRGRGALRVLGAYVEAGMTPAEALRAATWEGGRLLGDEGLGVVRAGAWADLVAFDGDPARDLAALDRVRLVLKGGVIERSDDGVCAG